MWYYQFERGDTLNFKNAILGMAVILIFLLSAGTDVQASQPSDFLIRNYTIEIEVYCLDEALRRLGAMPGIILNSRIHVQADWGAMDRRVTVLDLERKLADLQGLGRVVNMVSHSRNVFAEVSDLRSEWQVRNAEYNRLMALLYEVDTIDNFSQVENRLGNVISDMEWLSGRLNHLDFETGTARLGISLFAVDELEQPVAPMGAAARIGNAFMSSAGLTLFWIQAVLIFFVYASVPLAMFATVGFCVLYFVLIRKKRKKGGKSDEIEIIQDSEDKADTPASPAE